MDGEKYFFFFKSKYGEDRKQADNRTCISTWKRFIERTFHSQSLCSSHLERMMAQPFPVPVCGLFLYTHLPMSTHMYRASPSGSVVKNLPANARNGRDQG